MTKLATVSYLNAQPLIDGLDRENDIEVMRRVPSELLEMLESGEAGLALCPVIDFQQSAEDLEIVPAGAIGCDGPALTVKVFSRTPFDSIGEISVDGDSHTSVALLRVVLEELFNRRPALRSLPEKSIGEPPEALLLIGDKVIHSAPDRKVYPHELDLGAAWKQISDKPFVFATWMTRAGTPLGDLAERLDEIRRTNRERLVEIARRHAHDGGWPEDLAISYLSRNLRYDLGTSELEGIEEFWRRCHGLGIIDELRPMKLYGM